MVAVWPEAIAVYVPSSSFSMELPAQFHSWVVESALLGVSLSPPNRDVRPHGV